MDWCHSFSDKHECSLSRNIAWPRQEIEQLLPLQGFKRSMLKSFSLIMLSFAKPGHLHHVIELCYAFLILTDFWWSLCLSTLADFPHAGICRWHDICSKCCSVFTIFQEETNFGYDFRVSWIGSWCHGSSDHSGLGWFSLWSSLSRVSLSDESSWRTISIRVRTRNCGSFPSARSAGETRIIRHC